MKRKEKKKWQKPKIKEVKIKGKEIGLSVCEKDSWWGCQVGYEYT